MDALQIPRERWEETQYWDRIRREAEEEAKRVELMQSKKQNKKKKKKDEEYM